MNENDNQIKNFLIKDENKDKDKDKDKEKDKEKKDDKNENCVHHAISRKVK